MQDALTDPVIGVVAGESEGALALGVSLPDPDRMVPEDGRSVEATRAIDAWRESWSMAPEAGHAAREAIYRPLALALAPTLERRGVEEALTRLAEGVARAHSIASEQLAPRLATQVEEASAAQADAATAAWSRGR